MEVHNSNRGRRFIMIMIMIMIMIENAVGLNFKYPSFDTNTASGILLLNDASISSNGTISMNKEKQRGVGRVFYDTAVPLWTTTARASFITAFQIQIQNTSDVYFGDGIAFLMSGTPSAAPPNSSGGALGILDWSLNGLASNRIVAVEFDTFRNSQSFADIDNNHVGIDVNSVNSTASKSLYDRNIDLKFGTVIMAWVEYDGINNLLSVDVATYPFTKPTLGSPLITHQINLSQYLPNEIYVGFSAATGSNIEYHAILSWEFNSTSPFPSPPPAPLPSPAAPLPSPVNSFPPSAPEAIVGPSKRLSNGIIAVIALAVIFLILLPLLFCLIKRPKKKARHREWNLGDAELAQCAGPRRFTHKEIISATRNFSQDNYLGRGGFGPVYKGILPKVGTPVAVKSIGENSKQGEREFLAEVTIISRIRHRNLVQLQGWCHDKGQHFLVYDFMPNGSLDQHLFKKGNVGLDWKQRHNIVCGLAAGLLYLHQEWEKQVIHRDVKPGNVMLDQDFNARLGDFGLACLADHDQMPETTRAAGTFGYIAPEVAETGKATSASDVYSFGAVALEVACGRAALDHKAPPDQVRLVDWVWDLYSKDLLLEAADPRLGGAFDVQGIERMLCLGLSCSHPLPHSRPTMRQVHDCLLNETPIPPIPTSKPLAVYSNNFFQPPRTVSQLLSRTSTTATTTCTSSSITTTTDTLSSSSSTSSTAR